MKNKYVKLGDVLRVYSGVNLTQEKMDPNGNHPVYGGNGIIGNYSKYNIESSTIIIGRVGYYCGSVHLTEDKAWVTDNAFITEFAHDTFNKKYLYYLLKNLNLRQYSNSSAQPVISGGRIYSVECHIPPKKDQAYIAEVLDRSGMLNQKQQLLMQKYDELAQNIFYEMFGDSVKNENNWDIMKFSDCGSIDRGVSKHRPRNAPELLGGDYPLIQTGDISNSNGYIKKYNYTYSETGLKQSKLWNEGTLCITIAANIAKTGILTFKACFPDSVVGFISNGKVTVNYVRFWLSNLQKMLEDTAPESAQKNINLEILRNLNIPVPPIKLQKLFEMKLEKINSSISIAEEAQRRSSSLLKGLLNTYFN